MINESKLVAAFKEVYGIDPLQHDGTFSLHKLKEFANLVKLDVCEDITKAKPFKMPTPEERVRMAHFERTMWDRPHIGILMTTDVDVSSPSFETSARMLITGVLNNRFKGAETIPPSIDVICGNIMNAIRKEKDFERLIAVFQNKVIQDAMDGHIGKKHQHIHNWVGIVTVAREIGDRLRVLIRHIIEGRP